MVSLTWTWETFNPANNNSDTLRVASLTWTRELSNWPPRCLSHDEIRGNDNQVIPPDGRGAAEVNPFLLHLSEARVDVERGGLTRRSDAARNLEGGFTKRCTDICPQLGDQFGVRFRNQLPGCTDPILDPISIPVLLRFPRISAYGQNCPKYQDPQLDPELGRGAGLI